MTVLFSKVKIRKIEGREIVLRRLGAADELEAAVLFQQNLRGTELAIIIVAHGEAVSTGVVDINDIPDLDLGQHAVDGKLIVILAQTAHNIIYMIARRVFFSQHSDMIEVLSDHVENLSDAGLQNMMQRVADNSSAYVTGDYLMTDDKAPVELLGMQVIDQLIQEEVAYYKDIYEEQGISGLMEHL